MNSVIGFMLAKNSYQFPIFKNSTKHNSHYTLNIVLHIGNFILGGNWCLLIWNVCTTVMCMFVHAGVAYWANLHTQIDAFWVGRILKKINSIVPPTVIRVLQSSPLVSPILTSITSYFRSDTIMYRTKQISNMFRMFSSIF